MSDHLTKSVDGILKLFGPEKMMSLYHDFVRLFEMWNTTQQEESEMQELCHSELDQIRLIRTAYALSILAENHSRDLKRIVDRFPKFNVICEDIAKQSECINVAPLREYYDRQRPEVDD